MSKRKRGLPRQTPDVDDVAPDDTAHDDIEHDDIEHDDVEHDDVEHEVGASSSKPAARTAGGRFAPGHCPNPKGRPRKRADTGPDLLTRILDEKVEMGGAGRSKMMTMREVIVRSICAKGCKDPSVALALLKLDASCRQTAHVEEAPEEPEAVRAMLRGFVERENRREAVANGTADAGEEDDEPEA